MKGKYLFTCVFISFLFSCTNQEKNSTSPDVIDIEKGLESISKFKVSDFGKNIRYIPLETTDDCLIGNNPIVKVLKNHIIIEANKRCFLFDKKDGHFISIIGHTGQDPEAYNSVFSWADEKEEFLYFIRQPDKLIKYNMEGKFSGVIEFPSPPGLASYYLLTDTDIIGYYTGISDSGNPALAFFNKEGQLNDTIPSLLPRIDYSNEDIAGISVTWGDNTCGNWTKAGAIIIDYKNNGRQIIAPNATALWKSNGEIHFRENFIDTIYTITENRKLIPSIIFNTGKWHWPGQEKTSKNKNSERIFIADVSENNTFIFFQCIKGLYSNEPVLYNGLYNKKTGDTKLSKFSDAIQDDLTFFMPFNPLAISTSGEFVSLVEAYNIMEWLDEHPEAGNNKKLTFLKNMNEDMNPVIILVE